MSEIERLRALARYASERDRVPVDVTQATALTERRRGMHAAARQERIETGLAKRHLKEGTLVLYDVSSSYLEGRCCELARFGYSRDHRPDRLQIVYGLLCNREGCLIAVEVFEGDTADPMTLASQVRKLKARFGLERIVLVGDRGLITHARIREDLEPAGARLDHGPARPADQDAHRSRPAAALVVRRSRSGRDRLPRLSRRAAHRLPQSVARGRTQAQARRVAGRDRAGLEPHPPSGVAQACAAAGRGRDRARGRSRARQAPQALRDRDRRHEPRLSPRRQHDRRRGPPRRHLRDPHQCAERGPLARRDGRRLQGLGQVERAFRSIKTVDLEIRPVFHWTAPRVRAHVFLCMLAYYVEFHMRRRLAPILFDDHDRPAAAAERESIIAFLKAACR